ncbi:ABC transporter ATP-binding protein [Paenibacillus filicis]|uniref:ABC transporter ATP-binding protein n=1 Tax=Paenibacillus filicis TaxID=669464 RepID=A0ABU9DUX2_9BACL
MSHQEDETVLRVRSLQVTYKQQRQSVPVLHNLSFDLKKGEILALLGESGSGKSTLARAITGLLPPSAQIAGGALQLGAGAHMELTDKNMPWELIRGRRIGLLFQDAQQALNPVLRIREHFQESLRFHRLASGEEADAISIRLLGMLGFPDAPGMMERYPFQLSGGMCQRVCLALALCLKPHVLIADEPTSALDTVNQQELLHLLKKLQQELGLTVLLITHDIAVAHAVSDRVMVLHQGNVVEIGGTRAVLARPQSDYTRRLLASRSQIVRPVQDGKLTLQAGEPLLEIVGLEKAFGRRKGVLRDVHLALEPREVLGILGQSGCGKSTLARCIAGLEPVTGGRMLYRGADMTRLRGKARREMCKKIQLIFQNARASLNPGRTALELVQEPLRYLKLGSRKEREAEARHYLQEVGITGDMMNRKPPQLSSGQCQRIAIARALAVKPEVLICDEVVSALDMGVQAQILALLQRLHKQLGFSIVMISHDIRVLRSFCHQIAVMNQGSFIEGKQAAALLHESRHAYTQRLLQGAEALEAGLDSGRRDNHDREHFGDYRTYAAHHAPQYQQAE